MSPLFKYVSEERFAHVLIEHGEIYMQTLASFRDYEDADVRRDPDDGRLQYQPAAGLGVQVVGREADEPWEGWRLTSSVRKEDVYGYCLSTSLREELAERFESPFCVEILNPISLVGRVSRAARLRSSLERARAYHGPIDYRGLETIPAADWALPEKIALMKPEGWSWQDEYRILVGKKGAFDVENVRMTLERGPRERAPRVDHPALTLKVGGFGRGMRLHRF